MKQLSFYEFTQLKKEEQYKLTFTNGEFVGVSVKDDVKFALYKVFGFYIEVIYDSAGNEIIGLTSFLKSN